MDSDFSDDSGGRYSDLATEHGATTDNETDAVTDDEAFDPTALISAIHNTEGTTAAEGLQPYELFREQRRAAKASKRGGAAEAGPSFAGDIEFGERDEEDNNWMEERDRRRRTARRPGQGRRARKRRPTHISRGDLPPQGVELMQQANEAFAKGESQASVDLLSQCIQEYPNFVEPYVTLAAVFTDIGLLRNALHCYAIASHMKPSDAEIARSTAQLSMEFQFFKQAIWAWARCISKDRKDHEAHAQRLECYSEFIAQQEALGKAVNNITRMARAACNSMLKEFPDDPLVSLKLPVFLYKLSLEDEAVAFLSRFVENCPAQVQPTHINMLAQLHMERRAFERAVAVMEAGVGKEGAKTYVDLAVKMAICLLHLGDAPLAMTYLDGLRQQSAVDFNDLYAEVFTALADTRNGPLGFEMAQSYVDQMQRELLEAAVPEEAPGGRQRLAAMLMDTLPAVERCCSAHGDLAPVLQGYQLLRTHGSPDAPGFADLMLQLSDLLNRCNRRAEATAVLGEISHIAPTEPQSSLRLQAHAAEAHLASGDTKGFLEVMTSLLDGVVGRELSVDAEFPDIEPSVRRRIERMKRDTADAAAAGPSGRAPSGGGGAVTEDETSMFDHSELLPRAREKKKKKDRRTPAVRELDERAAQLLAARSDADTDAEGGGGSRSSRLSALLEQPVLFGLTFKALDLKADAGEPDWVAARVEAILLKFKRRADSEAQRRKAALQMLLLQCRVQQRTLQTLSQAQEKIMFGAWPCSLRLWNVFSRWCQHRHSIPHRLVSKLQESNPGSLPLMLLRGHSLSMTGSTGLALQQYFQAFEMLRENALINLLIATGYLEHAMSRSVGERHACLLKAFAFFCRYASFHTHKQEAAFNMGRAMHQLGLLDLAVDWYERALLLTESPTGEPIAASDDVRHEAAHNLCLIYSASGASALASRVMHKYCVV